MHAIYKIPSERARVQKRNITFTFIFLEGLNWRNRGRTSVATKDPISEYFLFQRWIMTYIYSTKPWVAAWTFYFSSSIRCTLQEKLRNSKNGLHCYFRQNKLILIQSNIPSDRHRQTNESLSWCSTLEFRQLQ